MSLEALKIPKRLKQITLWVHPLGRVIGSLFLHLQSNQSAGEEKPLEALNHPDQFLVVKCDDSDDIRFYNKRSIVRVQYFESQADESSEVRHLTCHLHMMDGSLLTGTIQEFLPPEHARLFDYVNMNDMPFIKLHLDNHEICLVNKTYIVQITPLDTSVNELVHQ
jgi:hypothetical protein